MFKVVERRSGMVVDTFKSENEAFHYAFLLTVQDRRDGCYEKDSYTIINPDGRNIGCR